MEISNTIDETEAVVEQTTSFFSGILQKIQDAIPTVLVAVVVFIIGALLAKLLQKAVKRGMKRSNIDDTAIGFFQSLIRVILYTVLIVICLSILKVPMSSIVAVIGAAGLAIGLALQNSLSNLAGGRPPHRKRRVRGMRTAQIRLGQDSIEKKKMVDL